jgi:hypothetical protein
MLPLQLIPFTSGIPSFPVAVFGVVPIARAGVEFPEPAWKSFRDFAPVMHPRQTTYCGESKTKR